MIRSLALIGFVVCLLAPLQAVGLWLPNDGQCFDLGEPVMSWEVDDFSAVQFEADPGCSGTLDPTDPSFNACFELAEHPISTLPELIAQNQAEQLVMAMLATSESIVVVTPLLPSPSEASIEDPDAPGRQLVQIAPPRAPRNACSVFADDCERAPVIPTLSLDGSSPQANPGSSELDVPPPIMPEMRRGPPALGVARARGVVKRLDRPPQAG